MIVEGAAMGDNCIMEDMGKEPDVARTPLGT